MLIYFKILKIEYFNYLYFNIDIFKNLNYIPFREEIKINKLNQLEELISEVREHLYEVINEKGDLLNPEVVAASKMLDSVLNTYSEVIKQDKTEV
ncbi:aspartyl-phosphate phosphatase Spo0E family protein [Clostridium aciditolerans]|uniref:aspartyl-phosphate phosphatase Spo0E family protein n=1 Tax=Clostridium aciditolerans TaxID=339861 RepID=UPI0031B59EB0